MDAPITPAEATRLIEAATFPLEIETLPLEQALGHQLREPLVADRPLPPYDRATHDGIAIAADSIRTGDTLRIIGLHAAGDPPPSQLLNPGEAWEIMTGAILPPGCDTVIPYEDLQWHDRPRHDLPAATLTTAFTKAQSTHLTGSDAAPGTVLVPTDAFIGPAEIAIAASIGKARLHVSRLPRIALLSTGDEAIPIETTPDPWQIRRSNGPTLAALLHALGFPVVFHQHATDAESSLSRHLDAALASADVLLLTGGISKGKRDLVRPLLEARLGPPSFHGILQRPGKPLAFWHGSPLVFALPGNPVSVLATFARYVRPALDRLSGKPATHQTLPVPPSLQPLPKLTWLLPVTTHPHLQPLPPQNSGDFTSIATATGILEVPPTHDFHPTHPLRYFPFFH